MGFNFSGALKGGVKGASEAAPSGNPYLIAGDAALRALLGAFGKDDAVPSVGGVMGGGDEGGDAEGAGGFSKDIIGKALDLFGNVGGNGEAPPPGILNGGTAGASGKQYIPPTLLGFPSRNAPKISDTLRAAMSARRGF